MTDLERLWEDLRTSPAPIGAILREARRGGSLRRRRVWLRPALVTATAAAVAGAFVLGTSVGGTGGSGGQPGGAINGPDVAGGASPVAFVAPLRAASSCRTLLSSYVDRGLASVTAYGWTNPGLYTFGPVRDLPQDSQDLAAQSGTKTMGRAPEAAPLTTTRSTASATGTNVQESGVDEPDTVKTNGTLLAQVHDGELRVYDVSGSRPRRRSVTPLDGFADPQLLLSGDTVVVLGTDPTSARSLTTNQHSGSRVETLSLADPRHPRVTGDVTYSATITAARQSGSAVRLVLSSGLPDIPFVKPSKGMPAAKAQARNRRVLQRSTIADWLPTYDAGHGSKPLLSCGSVAIPPDRLGLDTVSVVGFPVTHPADVHAIGLAGATGISYESQHDLYLAATPTTWPGCWGCVDGVTRAGSVSGGTTYVFQFALHGDTATQVASGAVDGILADRWSMDETGGVLRLALGRSSTTGNFNQVVTMERHGAHLRVVGRLSHLGAGEQIKSVRWFGRDAIVTTFRQRDPMYVVDLRRPDHPTVAGRLDLPGYSAYLHPLGTRRLIGVGAGPGVLGRWRAQMGFFRVRDLPRIQSLDTWHYRPGSTALAATNPLLFTWLPEYRTVLTVIRKGTRGWLSVQHLAHQRLHNTMLPVGYGSDVSEVRTIGLPSGKVVLVTANGARFLDL